MTDVTLLTLTILHAAGVAAYAALPDGVSRPVLRIEEAGGGPLPNSAQPIRLIRQDLQLTAWADTKQAALTLLTAAYQSLHSSILDGRNVTTAGTLIRVETLGGVLYLPDPDWPVSGQPGPRYELTVRLTAHD